MVNYTDVVQSGVSMLITIIIGFIVNKLDLIPLTAVGQINKFLLQLCYLPLLMRVIGRSSIQHVSIMPFIIGICGNVSSQLILLVIFFFKLEDRFKTYISIVLPSVYINYLIVGFPIFNAIWDESENVMITVMCLSNDMLSVPTYLLLSNIYSMKKENREHKMANDGQSRKFSFKIFLYIGKRLFKNPIIIGIILGFVYSATGCDFCNYLDSLLGTMGNCVLALCLYCVGGFLSQHSLVACHWGEFLTGVFVRHVVMPGFVALYSYAFGISGKLARQCTIMAGLPSATASYILSVQSGIGPGVSSTLIFWTTVFCVPFMLLWLFLFNSFNIFPED